MISSLQTSNFKSLKDVKIKMRPLTILMGKNGSGKSSLVQLLLLLKENAVDDLGVRKVKLYSDLYDLGTQSDVLYRWSDDSEILASLTESSGGDYSASFKLSAECSDCDYLTINDSSSNSATMANWLQHNIYYLSADRIPPMTHHKKSAAAVKDRDIGKRGENAVAVLNAMADHPVDIAVCHDLDSQVNSENIKHIDATLKGQVDAWLKEIAFGASVLTIPNKDQIDLVVSFGKGRDGRGFRPENVGFGISYVLPVLVLLLVAKRGDCVIIENPEAHLHPTGQSALGRLLARVANNGVQVIVETHSDHVINGVRVAVHKRANGSVQDGISKDEAIIYFFERREKPSAVEVIEQYTEVTPIEFMSDGELTCYPNDFLDEWTNQLKNLWF